MWYGEAQMESGKTIQVIMAYDKWEEEESVYEIWGEEADATKRLEELRRKKVYKPYTFHIDVWSVL